MLVVVDALVPVSSDIHESIILALVVCVFERTTVGKLRVVAFIQRNAIHLGMREVVESKPYFSNIGVNVAGKTGTAQERTDRANHALFVGYAPYESPEIAIATRVAYGYSSSYAAQITKDVFQYYYNESERDEIRSGVAQELDNTSANAD